MMKTFDRAMPPPRIADAVTMQGVKQISDATSGAFRRVFWFLVVCGGLSFTGFNIAKQIIHYRSSPVSVNIDMKLADKMSFPTITICNNNLIRKSFLEKFNMTGFVMGLFPYDFQVPDPQQVSGATVDSADSLNIDRIIKLGGHSLNLSIELCVWHGGDCVEHMLTPVSTDLGICFAFNANGSLQASSSGRSNGLHILLNAHAEEYVRSSDNTEGAGFRVAVHSPDVPPLMGDIGVALSPGFQHFLGLSTEITLDIYGKNRDNIAAGMAEGRTTTFVMQFKVVTAPKGLDNCGTSKLRYYQKEYSREACRIECLTDFVVDLCNCRDMYMPGNASFCLPSQAAYCVSTVGDEYAQYQAKCNAQCPTACSLTLYDVKMQPSLRLSDEYLTALAYETGDTYEYWKENVVSLDVYFTSMSYMYLEKRYSYLFLDLLCDIGGALGLFLGASLATAIELLDFSFRNILAGWVMKSSPTTIHVKPNT